jgi:hypothetical protein
VREIIVGLFPVFVASAVLFGPLAGLIAALRSRNPLTWLGFGALIGPIAVLLVWLAPENRCRICDLPTRGWLTTCSRHAEPAGSFPEVAAPPRVVPVPMAPRTEPFGRPAATTRPATAAPRPTGGGTILASGVFEGGTEPLVPGSRYAIARVSDRVRVLGPLDTSPDKVRLDRSLADLTVGTHADRLLLTGPSEAGGPSFVLSFHALAGVQGAELEAALAVRHGRRASAGSARS